MQNLDKELVEVINKRLAETIDNKNIDSHLTEENIQCIVKSLVKGFVQEHIVAKTQDFLIKQSSNIIMNLIDDLFNDEHFLLTLKEHAKERVIQFYKY